MVKIIQDWLMWLMNKIVMTVGLRDAKVKGGKKSLRFTEKGNGK